MKYAVVIGTQRSGTTVLRALLESHPEITTFGEVFLPRHVHLKECYYNFLMEQISIDPNLAIPERDTVRGLFSRYLLYLEKLGEKAGWIIFDCKYNFLKGALSKGDMAWSEPPHMLSMLREHGFKILHMQRTNVLESLVSSLLSVKNQVWATEDLSRIKFKEVEVRCDDLVMNLRHRKEELAYFTHMLSGTSTLEIEYDSVLENGTFTSEFLAELSRFLGVENRFVSETKLKKIAPPLDKAISNYEEVDRALANTEFTHLLQTQEKSAKRRR